LDVTVFPYVGSLLFGSPSRFLQLWIIRHPPALGGSASLGVYWMVSGVIIMYGDQLVLFWNGSPFLPAVAFVWKGFTHYINSSEIFYMEKGATLASLKGVGPVLPFDFIHIMVPVPSIRVSLTAFWLHRAIFISLPLLSKFLSLSVLSNLFLSLHSCLNYRALYISSVKRILLLNIGILQFGCSLDITRNITVNYISQCRNSDPFK